MLTHENLVASNAAVILQMGEHRPRSSDVLMSFLPLAHMLERSCENALLMVGASIGYFTGDIHNLSEDMKALRPTMVPAVPRLLNRIYDRVQAEISSSFVKKILFNMALKAKESEIKR